MAELEKVIIAGTTGIPDLLKFRDAFADLGISASFAEAQFMLKYIQPHKEDGVLYAAELPAGSIVIPLSEYWISYCIRTGQCLISEKALASSRSKKYFYNLLSSSGADSVRYYDCGACGRAEVLAAVEHGGRIVVKPEGLYSGFGIEVISKANKEKLDVYIRQSQAIKTHTMRLMEIKNEGCMLTEYLDGTEYSADCFFYRGRISIVRVCRKRVVLIHDKPCTAIYQLIQPSAEITRKLTEWMRILFDSGDISFAQFDFISTPAGRIVPIDFASRIGGGLGELMGETGTNPYADAVRGECRLYQDGTVLTQFNYLPVKTGHLKNDNFNFIDGRRFVFKHTGDYVIQNPSSIGSRIALVIKACDTDVLPDGIEQMLLVDGRWIE